MYKIIQLIQLKHRKGLFVKRKKDSDAGFESELWLPFGDFRTDKGKDA